jgi:AcrR family transcriptional regulator
VTDPSTTSDLGMALSTAAVDVVAVIARRRAAKARPIEQTAQRISASAFALFGERGFDAVTVGDIAAHAGVTARTFYRYYPSKETVIIDINDQTNERLVELIERVAPGTDIFDGLRLSLTTWFAEYDSLLVAVARLSAGSPALNSVLLLHSTDWEAHIASALRERFPGLGADGAAVWAVIFFGLLRLTAVAQTQEGGQIASTAERLTLRFRALVSEPAPVAV